MIQQLTRGEMKRIAQNTLNTALLTLSPLFVDTYTMLPAVVSSLSTRVRADGSCLFVYKSMLNPGGKAIVSKGRFSVCAAVYADRTHRHIHNRRHADWLKAILSCLIDGCSKVHR